MKRNTPFPSANHKDHFIYENLPFINPEHGKLHKIEWATVIDTSQIKLNDYNIDEYITPPRYYLQITSNGELRGVSHDYDDHEDYFSVTADESDVVFLKLFADQHPKLTPTLTSLLIYRKERAARFMQEIVDESNRQQ